MKIYSCETHIDQALDDFITKEEKLSDYGSCTGERKVIHKVYIL